jgi:beta-glucosidase
MCYLPGSEGKGVSDVLCGCNDFIGKLPSDWYGSLDQIGTDKCFLKRGYGESYGENFKPRKGPEVIPDTSLEIGDDNPMFGTNFTNGLFKDGVYTNEYADIRMNIPGELTQLNDSDISWISNFVLSLCTDEKDKLRETATVIDQYFENSSYSISFLFINTRLGSPDRPDCTEEELLDDWKEFLMGDGTPPGSEFEYEDREKVTLGGNEYVRDVCSMNYEGTHQYYYDYARRLDDELMCIIEINGSKKISPEEFEAMFK